MSIKHEVYSNILPRETSFTIKDVVEDTGTYRQAVEHHLRALIEMGAISKPSRGTYVVVDRQVMIDEMTFVPDSKLRDETLLKGAFPEIINNMNDLQRYAKAKQLPILSRDMRKKLSVELKAAEHSIKAARAILANAAPLSKKQIDALDVKFQGRASGVIEIYEQMFGRFTKEHDWQEKLK